jgi:uridylate kinase
VENRKSIVLKIGGSMLYNNALEVNFDLLKKLKTWYYDNKERFNKIVIVVGGGELSRDMHKRISDRIGGEGYLHNIAMSVTQTNAALIQAYLEDPDIYLPKKLGDAYEFLMGDDSRYMVSGGLKVGWSTDMDAAVFTDILDVDYVYKISDVDHIYTDDPNSNPDAQPINDLTWDQYYEMFDILPGSEHTPNKNIPIDVECALFSKRKDVSFYICGGKSTKIKASLDHILEEGTLVHP